MVETIAILGATGKTGREVLKRLLETENVKLKIYVRSSSKLLALFPDLLSNSRVSIFEGPLTDIANMSKCLDDTQKVIFTIGENENIKGVNVIETGAKSVLAALTQLREGKAEWQRPRLLMLSSATWNSTLAADRPAPVHWAIKNAFIYPYADLRRGTALFLDASLLVNVLLVQPNALIQDEPSGHSISVDRASLSVTYGDLGAGFVDLACDERYAALSYAGVSSKGGDNGLKYGPILAYTILRGLCATFIPGFWPMNRFLNGLWSSLTWSQKRQ